MRMSTPSRDRLSDPFLSLGSGARHKNQDNHVNGSGHDQMLNNMPISEDGSVRLEP
jgi:hypothetical protein